MRQPKRLLTVALNQRVKVIEVHAFAGNHEMITINALGTVTRVCTNGRAWVTLDEYSVAAVHPFVDGPRRLNVQVWPEQCEPAVKSRAAGNRKSRRRNEAIAKEPVVTVDMFGKDHWSTFGYLATCAIDGRIACNRMRCDEARHPLLAHEGSEIGGASPTRLKNGEIKNHDDWDCFEDLERAGFVENVGSRINPCVRLTLLGSGVARQLAEHKQSGGNFATFAPEGVGVDHVPDPDPFNGEETADFGSDFGTGGM